MSEFRRTLARQITEPLARLLAKTGLGPNTFTIFGFLLALVVAWVLASGHLFLGGFLVVLAGGFDLVDGAVARASGRSTRFGALLDSTVDRFSEAALLLGLVAYYAGLHSTLETLLVGATLAGSMVTSYVKARAEGLGLGCEVGLLTRPERVILLALGLVLSPIGPSLLVVLWILAVGTNLTAIQRLFYLWQQTRGE